MFKVHFNTSNYKDCLVGPEDLKSFAMKFLDQNYTLEFIPIWTPPLPKEKQERVELTPLSRSKE